LVVFWFFREDYDGKYLKSGIMALFYFWDEIFKYSLFGSENGEFQNMKFSYEIFCPGEGTS